MSNLIFGAFIAFWSGSSSQPTMYQCEPYKGCGYTDVMCVHSVVLQHDNQQLGSFSLHLTEGPKEFLKTYPVRQAFHPSDRMTIFDSGTDPETLSKNWLALRAMPSETLSASLHWEHYGHPIELECQKVKTH